MARGRVLAALASVVLAAGAGCGGGDDPNVSGPGPESAEDTAREFLVAGVDGDADRACGLLTDELIAELEDTFPCTTLVEVQADLAKQGKAEFDTVKIDSSNVEELDLQTFVSEDGLTANVTGPAGEQNIGLEVLNGDWVIASLPSYEQPS
jgi:hypothetical protein